MNTLHSDPVTQFGQAEEGDRPLGRSIMRGLLNRCPNCGTGKLFRSFLKPVDHCAVCNEAMHHQRADDLPPYIVILVLGHIAVGGYMLMDAAVSLPLWAHMAIWVPVTVAAALLSIQPVKGGVIGLQWALKMHGFGGHDDDVDDFTAKNDHA